MSLFRGIYAPLFSISVLSIDSKIGDNNHIYSKLRSFISSENRDFYNESTNYTEIKQGFKS